MWIIAVLSATFVMYKRQTRMRYRCLIDSSVSWARRVHLAKFKKEIQPMGTASEAILALKPVTFHYKSDKDEYPAIWLDCRGSSADES